MTRSSRPSPCQTRASTIRCNLLGPDAPSSEYSPLVASIRKLAFNVDFDDRDQIESNATVGSASVSSAFIGCASVGSTSDMAPPLSAAPPRRRRLCGLRLRWLRLGWLRLRRLHIGWLRLCQLRPRWAGLGPSGSPRASPGGDL